MIGLRAQIGMSTIVAAVIIALTPTSVHSDPIPGGPRIIVMGDSIAAGWVVSEKYAWPSRLADRMRGEDHSWMTVRAIGGRCLVAPGCAGETVASAWESALVARPTTMILAVGENDLGKIPAHEIKAAIASLVDRAHAAGIQVLVATIPPQERSRWPTWYSWGEDMINVNSWIRETYGPTGDVLDWYAVLVNPETGWMREEFESGDGVHPNRYGHIELADSVSLRWM